MPRSLGRWGLPSAPHVGNLPLSPLLCTHPPWGPAKLPLRPAVSWPLSCQLGQKPLLSPLSPSHQPSGPVPVKEAPPRRPTQERPLPASSSHARTVQPHTPRPPSSRQTPYSPCLGLPFRSQNPHLHPALFTSRLPCPRALEVALLLRPPSSASSCPAPGSATLT